MAHRPESRHVPSRGSMGLAGLASRAAEEGSIDGVWSWVFHLDRLAQAGVMAGGLAHDARNLLAGISGTCELALLKGESGDSRETLNRINSLALQAAEAMSVFLTFARRSDVVPRPCRVLDVAEDALKVLEPTIRKGRALVTLDIESGLRVYGERTLVLQALVNLTLNALKAIGEGEGHVAIRARAEGEFSVIEVADDGPGIAPGILPLLFRPFGTGSHASEGTGLGLFITRRILEQQGGRIDVESTPGAGTTFRIHLRSVGAHDRSMFDKELAR